MKLNISFALAYMLSNLHLNPPKLISIVITNYYFIRFAMVATYMEASKRVMKTNSFLRQKERTQKALLTSGVSVSFKSFAPINRNRSVSAMSGKKQIARHHNPVL